MFKALPALALLALTPLPALAGELNVSSAYTFATPPGAAAAGGYLTIINHGEADDRLIGAEAGFARVEIHRTETDDAGVARMLHQAEGVPLPAGGTVTLEPGGLHLMMMGLGAPLVKGETAMVTLHFEEAGSVEVMLPVILRGEDVPAMDHGGHSGHSGHGSGN